MVLDSLVANNKTKAALLHLCESGRLPQAIVLEGPVGAGRFTLAKMIAALAVCRAGCGCGECPDCRMALAGQHPDVELYAKDGQTGNLTIKSLRAINQSVATPPVQARRRVVILRDIQDAAQVRTLNTLLKVIEEPPPYLMFLLTVDNREHLLPTILSRCLLLRMELPAPADCAREVDRLLGGGTEPGELGRMCALSGGNIGRAVRLLSDTPEAASMRDALAAAAAALEPGGYALLALLRKYERDRAGYRLLLADLREVFSRLLPAKYLGEAAQGPLGEEGLRVTAPQALRALDVLDEAGAQAQYNLNLPLALTRLGVRLHGAICG